MAAVSIPVPKGISTFVPSVPTSLLRRIEFRIHMKMKNKKKYFRLSGIV